MMHENNVPEQRNILLLLFPSFSEYEVTIATAVLRDTHHLTTVALVPEPVTGESGLQVMPHAALDEIDPSEYEALIIPGGNMFYLKRARPLFDFVRTLHDQGTLLAAICSGPYVLARAGVLASRRYTVTLTPQQRAYLGCFEERGFCYDPIVEDENVLTAQGHAYVEFGLRIGERLGAIRDNTVHDFYRGVRDFRMMLIS
ncbi:MAG: DJ-1/PfpI family protein [Chloroflexota bacterium]|nr:DJ-1/PfpI family protein [Chloroflexota bacterium]